ncbi:MAG: hypothetical protein ABI370_13430 [Gammaproteobacteria bacterium]
MQRKRKLSADEENPLIKKNIMASTESVQSKVEIPSIPISYYPPQANITNLQFNGRSLTDEQIKQARFELAGKKSGLYNFPDNKV